MRVRESGKGEGKDGDGNRAGNKAGGSACLLHEQLSLQAAAAAVHF